MAKVSCRGVELLPLHRYEQETFVVHANAVLTLRGRLMLARRVVDEGWPIVRAAEHFHVSWPTAKRWASRYAVMGEADMSDRSSRPHHSPHRTPAPVVRRIVELRWRHRLALAIASRLSMSAPTVHAVLVRCRLNRLSHIDIRTGELIRRYAHNHPGSLIRVDVKKLGNIPDGGGWRFVGRAKGWQNRHAMPNTKRSRSHHELLGHAFVHTVIDDHSRVAYAEIHDDETAATAIGVLHRAVA
jgi:leucine-zipper of insertion element IS481/Integrase core domain